MTRRPGLAARLLAAQLLAIGAGVVTFALAALAAGPPLFRTHIGQALGAVPPALSRHLQDAFAAAAGISIGGWPTTSRWSPAPKSTSSPCTGFRSPPPIW